MRRLFATVLLASLSTVAVAKKGAWAEIDGSFANPAHADEVDLVIRGVNDKRYEPMRPKVEVKPGPVWLTVATTRKSAGGSVAAMPYVFKAEPCMRYLLAAQHDGPSESRYRVELVGVERIGECTLPEGYVPPVAAPVTEPSPVAAPVPVTEPAPVAAPVPGSRPADETGASQY